MDIDQNFGAANAFDRAQGVFRIIFDCCGDVWIIRGERQLYLTSPLSIWIDFTNPNEIMSRVKPGYFTDFNAFFTCSSEIDIGEFTCAMLEVNLALVLATLGSARASRARFGAIAETPLAVT